MKKILLTLLTPVLVSPVLAGLACHAQVADQVADQEKPPVSDQPEPDQEDKILPQKNRLNMEAVQKLPRFEVNGKPYNVINDGLYLVKKDYRGIFWWGDEKHGTQVDAQVVPLHTGMEFGTGLSLFENGDSFYVLYNDDDHDGHSIAHFLGSFYLDDTNLITNHDAWKVNRAHFEATKIFRNQHDYSIGIPFQKTGSLQGATPRYYCEQSKRIKYGAWHDYFADYLAKETNPDAIAVASNFWNVKTTPNQKGEFDHKNPGNPGAHQNWYPLVGEADYFSYQVTHRNAVKVTFNKTPNKPYVDARFVLARDNSLSSEGHVSAQNAKIYSAVIGGKDWHGEYLKALTYTYQFRAVKKAFPKNDRIHKLGDSYVYHQKKHATWLGQQLDQNRNFKNFRLAGIDGSNYGIKFQTFEDKPNEWIADLHHLVPDGYHFRLTKSVLGDYVSYLLTNVSRFGFGTSEIFAIKEALVE